MIVNYYPGGSVDKIGTPLRYTGSFFVKIDENNQDNWECHLLTSGTLTTEKSVDVDIFLVGGGGGGSGGPQYSQSAIQVQYGWGGAGGYTSTQQNCSLLRNVNYAVTIGEGGTAGAYPNGQGGTGEATSIISDNSSMNFEVFGGGGGGSSNSANGKAVGGRTGGMGASMTMVDGERFWSSAGGGSPAFNVVENFPNEYSKDAKVSAFWEDGASPYAGGGAGGGIIFGGRSGLQTGNIGGEGGGGTSCHDGMPNTGGGGGGGYSDGAGYTAGNGGSGIIIIRNHRSAT